MRRMNHKLDRIEGNGQDYQRNVTKAFIDRVYEANKDRLPLAWRTGS